MSANLIDLSNNQLRCVLRHASNEHYRLGVSSGAAPPRRSIHPKAECSVLKPSLSLEPTLSLSAYGLPDLAWAQDSSALFAIEVNGQQIDARCPQLHIGQIELCEQQPGQRVVSVQLSHDQTGLLIHYHLAVYSKSALIESWLEIENQGTQSQHISRIDSLVLDLPQDSYQSLGFTGSWGLEFEPHSAPLTHDLILESRSGRSSHGHYPWFALFRHGSSVLSGAVAWSGNWIMRIIHTNHGYRLSGGLHDWEFASELAPGQRIIAPAFVLALAPGNDLNAIAAQYAYVGRRYWYPHNFLSDTLPVEWNHWWSYEDTNINEAVFRDNVDRAAALGIEVCTLDAGWFGASDTDTHWYEQRGDWQLVNR